jgi:hypothetical protein
VDLLVYGVDTHHHHHHHHRHQGMHIGSFKRNSRFNTGIMTMQTAVANAAAAVGAGAGGAALGSSTVGGPAGGGLSLTMSMSGVGERSVPCVVCRVSCVVCRVSRFVCRVPCAAW